MCGVYTIRYKNNVYVGCTTRPFKQRFAEHVSDLSSDRACNPGLRNIVSARGIDVLEFKPVIYCTNKDDVWELEKRTYERYKRAGYKMLNGVTTIHTIAKSGRGVIFTDDEIRMLWEEHGSVYGIARATGIGHSTVRAAVRRIGIVPKATPSTELLPDDLQKMQEMLNSGLKPRTIRRKFRIGERRMARLMSDNFQKSEKSLMV